MSLELLDYCKEGNLQGIKELVEEGADSHADNEYALRYSARHGYLEIVKYFVSLGSDIHAENEAALRESAARGHLEIVKYLVSLGADIHETNEYALRLSARNGRIEVTKFLVSLGADIHALNEYALRWSARYGHLEVTKFLVSQGANVDIAIKNVEHNSTVRILKRYIPRNLYKGAITDQTETECGICLTELTNNEDLTQCKICKKCTHLSCSDKWIGPCIYCRN